MPSEIQRKQSKRTGSVNTRVVQNVLSMDLKRANAIQMEIFLPLPEFSP